MGKIKKIKDIIIYRDKNYNSFPNIIKKGDGELYVGFRQAPFWLETAKSCNYKLGLGITHVDPVSKAVYVTSKDNGISWSQEAVTLYDNFAYGVQDPCLNLLSDGTILCTFFMWKVMDMDDLNGQAAGGHIIQNKWVGRLVDAHTIRSFDGGKTWDEPIPIKPLEEVKLAVRGNTVELEDGTVLLLAYASLKPGGPTRSILLETRNAGKDWSVRSEVPIMEDCDMGEPNLYKTDGGKLVAFIRGHRRNQGNVYDPANVHLAPLVTCESYDDGKSWNTPTAREIFSPSPYHPLRLRSGNILVSYGYRYKPYGLRAFILDSECSSFDNIEETILRDDAFGLDIGYTSATQLDNGDILIVYYYFNEENGYRYIAGTICREE